MSLPKRRIGSDYVSAIGWGGMGFGGYAYGEAGLTDEERFKILDRLVELDCTHWDTADIYGDSEEVIGKYISRNPTVRSKIFLSTKFGFQEDLSIRADPEYVREAFQRSITRLGVEKIDIFYLHRVDTRVPIETSVRAMAELVKQGRLRYIGLSETSPDGLRRAHAIHPIAAIQVEYSPFFVNIEQSGHLLDIARELGIAVVAYAPLGRGLLTGQYKSWADFAEVDLRKTIPKYSPSNFPKILDLVKEIESVASKHDATPGQVAVAWVLAQGDDVMTIPGSKKIKYIEENINAYKLKLSKGEIDEIRKFCDAAEIPGRQYGDLFFAQVYAETPALKDNV